MSYPLVTFTQGASNDAWERLREVISNIWLHEARNLSELVHTLRDRYAFVSTEKMCRSRLKAWGLSTYKKSKGKTTQTASSNPPRKRKSRPMMGTLAPVLQQPDVYRVPMIFINLVDQLILALFQNAKPWSTHLHLIRPKVSAMVGFVRGNYVQVSAKHACNYESWSLCQDLWTQPYGHCITWS
ncbi:clr5 domain-containing protein [Trichoderma breve]|uniref:Clr5 domain-containing protein n=1 Tax=Trichoderma breve TaxID=2034170 RepID=A0A9W9EEP9_9HYPO|nr:clr5 domain-containing protein [Trichoderma breve]KAJ4865448.1 clr5 domain-containing protein [Trichoderma breve]